MINLRMNKGIFIFFLIIIPSFLIAQNSDTVYFDKKWTLASSRDYNYYRVCTYIDTLVKITDYYKNDTVQMTGSVKNHPDFDCSKIDEQNQIGLYKWYNKKGVIEKLKVYDLLNHSHLISEIYSDTLLLDKDLKLIFDAGYDKNGLIKGCGYIIDNCQRHGNWIFFRKDGSIYAKENYYYGVLNGKCLYYDKSGNLWNEMNYKDGKKHGKQITYDIKYSTESIVNYNNGKKIEE